MRLPIFGSERGRQGQVHRGLPARRRNYFGQDTISKNEGQRNLAKLKLIRWGENGIKIREDPVNFCDQSERVIRASDK